MKDLEGDIGGRKLGRPKGAVAKIRLVHHTVAELYANDFKIPEIAIFVRRTPATIRNWIELPAFQELVREYRKDRKESIKGFAEYRQELAERLSIGVLERLVEKVESNEDIPIRDLVRAGDSAHDRTGFGRQETKVNLNLNVAAQMDEIRARQSKLIEAQAQGHENVVKFVRRI